MGMKFDAYCHKNDLNLNMYYKISCMKNVI